ncbi:MAG: glycogen/starch/alpha-glucan phosphorylase [Leptospiraceae bacterium]|nr:glycogen/starch/alpha-glucan phosphorylase [Leptospiraceae bacterium]
MVPYGLDSEVYNRHRRLIDRLAKNIEIDVDSLIRSIAYRLEYSVGKYFHDTTEKDIYLALAYTIRNLLIDRYNATQQRFREKKARRVYYLSMEFLIGRSLESNLIGLDIQDTVEKVIEALGYELEKLYGHEADAGLGNGGLGRLAACFLDSMATLDLPCYGAGLRYEFGLFKQRINNGYQEEEPDNWMVDGNPWEIHRSNLKYDVFFYGSSGSYISDTGERKFRWEPGEVIRATAYDMMVPGFQNETVNHLRLWTASPSSGFNLDYFNHGDYNRAMQDKLRTESITKVLYPNDNTLQGSELRLKQEYLLVSATLQDALATFRADESSWLKLPDRVRFQLNDTHPAAAIPELIRLLIDEHDLSWKLACDLSRQCISYTNHTVMPEALEKWEVSLFGRLLPRILEIIEKLNFEYLAKLEAEGYTDAELQQMSVFEEGSVKKIRMANLAVMGSHTVNGVAALHSGLVRDSLFPLFARHNPGKFQNKTNGITPRRWLYQSNPQLTDLISQTIGKEWINDLPRVRELEGHADNPEFQESWAAIKEHNKWVLSNYIQRTCGVIVNTNSIFDVQVKRIHEYKRQLLNVLRIIHDYLQLVENPDLDYYPRTFVFAGKAAPGYTRAKLIIKLINAVADVVNNDEHSKDKMTVVFVPNFGVSVGEIIYPGTDLSEQISTAGTEASGTGNMKFMMNGALTVGTLDGANIEIRDEVGPENIYIFGNTIEQIHALAENYDAHALYHDNLRLHLVINAINQNLFSKEQPNIFADLVSSLLDENDKYFLFADFDAYLDCQQRISTDFQDAAGWTRRSILNTARSAHFSSDRTIREYARDIWQIME